MYPVNVDLPLSRVELSSMRMSNSYAADSDGVKPFEGTTRVVHVDVATFDEIVKWYAERIGETRLPQTLDRFVDEGKTGPGIGFFKTAELSLASHLSFRFTPEQKHITILHTEETGDVVAVSLLGLNHETNIHVLRHRRHAHAIAPKAGEPDDARESPR
ncbi:hypothetical protein [Rubripirellula reticaptiva]|nr:hypothetical protein [Rubripirellula reticaptiva]